LFRLVPWIAKTIRIQLCLERSSVLQPTHRVVGGRWKLRRRIAEVQRAVKLAIVVRGNLAASNLRSGQTTTRHTFAHSRPVLRFEMGWDPLTVFRAFFHDVSSATRQMTRDETRDRFVIQ
jgi:hypothetical protein